jgi:uracil-DNA glycosylase family 4
MTSPPSLPAADCRLCPRLAGFRDENRARHGAFFNAPVPSFGGEAPRLLIVGLAPGLKGANRTGRPFTGDYAGDLLYPTLLSFGWAEGRYGADPADGLRLQGCRITNAVRCVPPENKPTTPEIKTCNAFLAAEIESLRPGLKALLALGGIAHGACLTALGLKKSAYRFAHGARHELPDGLLLANSYHCSRYNTNTGRLTPEMFEDVFRALEKIRA